MKVLIIDRDGVSTQMLKSKLELLGHEITVEEVKNDAIGRLADNNYDLIFLDPAPLTSARPLLLNIRRSVNNYPYIFVTSQGIKEEEALKVGVNDCFPKPYDTGILDQKIENVERLLGLVKRIGDDSEDFPSAGGVIAKSAFNQLFLSGIDRADRYGEQTYILFIALKNYTEILQMDGPYAAEYASAKLSQYLVRLRRQSDIIGQTAKYEFSLMLQRPIYATEPEEAANRFADTLGQFQLNMPEGNIPLEIAVSLIGLPTGNRIAYHEIALDQAA